MPRRFTLPDVRPNHPAVRQWLAAQPAPLGAIAAHWFRVFRAAGPDVGEVMHDGQATACVGDAAFGYVSVHRAHVNIGFFDGAGLPDPYRLLQGRGRSMRHVSVAPDRPVDDTALAALIHAAYAAIALDAE